MTLFSILIIHSQHKTLWFFIISTKYFYKTQSPNIRKLYKTKKLFKYVKLIKFIETILQTVKFRKILSY